MSAPTVTSVAEASPAARAGLAVGDELLSLNGQEPRDVIDFQQLTDADDLSVMVKRAGAALPRLVRIDKEPGEPFGVEVSSAVFDRIRTCDNHCAFCFIYQLPKGMRKSLYLKDDDYRLSFLYGNFTTLTRFTELDAERILTDRLGPLFVSIHSTDPELRAHMLRNPKGATSLRWLSVLLDGGIEVHGQVVVCPGVNDAMALEDTLAGVLDQYPALATSASCRWASASSPTRPRCGRPHHRGGGLRRRHGDRVAGHLHIDARTPAGLRRRRVLPVGRPAIPRRRCLRRVSPTRERDRHGPGLHRQLHQPRQERPRRRAARVLRLRRRRAGRGLPGHPPASDRRRCRMGPRHGMADPRPVTVSPVPTAPGSCGHCSLPIPATTWRCRRCANDFFGGNIGVAGLLTGEDLARALSTAPPGTRYLLPDACLNEGRFLDGLTLADLPCAVEVVPTDGHSLRAALDGTSFRSACAA